MLDKNPNQNSTIRITEVMRYLEEDTLAALLCNEPFVKATFLSKFIEEVDKPIIYLDFDLLYSGYIKAKMLPKNTRVSLFTPSKNDWNDTLKKILLMLLNRKFIVIIDSLNGFYSLFDDKDVGRLVNSYIMLLVFVARESGSCVLFSSIVKKKESNGWVLSPTGRHIIDVKMSKFFLKNDNSELIINVIGRKSP